MGLVLAMGAVVLLALALRLPGLTDKPLHYDEGVNGRSRVCVANAANCADFKPVVTSGQ